MTGEDCVTDEALAMTGLKVYDEDWNTDDDCVTDDDLGLKMTARDYA